MEDQIKIREVDNQAVPCIGHNMVENGFDPVDNHFLAISNRIADRYVTIRIQGGIVKGGFGRAKNSVGAFMGQIHAKLDTGPAILHWAQ